MLGELLRRFLCGLGGHELVRSYAPSRVYLKCTSCTYETRGWTFKEPRQPIVRRVRALIARWAGPWM